MCCVIWLISISKYAQEKQEHINKIKIKCKRTHNGGFFHTFVIHKTLASQILQFLRVIGGKANKDGDTQVSDDPVHHFVLQKHIDYGRNDNPDKAHNGYISYTGQVFFRVISI